MDPYTAVAERWIDPATFDIVAFMRRANDVFCVLEKQGCVVTEVRISPITLEWLQRQKDVGSWMDLVTERKARCGGVQGLLFTADIFLDSTLWFGDILPTRIGRAPVPFEYYLQVLEVLALPLKGDRD